MDNAVAMARTPVDVADELFDELRTHLNDAQLEEERLSPASRPGEPVLEMLETRAPACELVDVLFRRISNEEAHLPSTRGHL